MNGDDTEKLMVAINSSDEIRVASLLQGEVDVNVVSVRGLTPLLLSAGKGNVEITKALLEKNAIVDFISKFGGMTPLMCAASQGHRGVLLELLKAGADESLVDSGNSTAYLFAVMSKRESVYEEVREEAIALGFIPRCESTALRMLIQKFHCMEKLIEHGVY